MTARRRHCPQAGMGEQARDESNKPREVLEPTPQFGGSGARFATLRNRRGVKGGADGMIQTRLRLSIVNDGGGKFSLCAGESDGKSEN